MKAAIDIGTNTVLLLVAKVKGDDLEIVKEEQRVPRLGQGVDQSGQISSEAVERVIDVLNYYKDLLASEYSDLSTIYVTATSAVRDARNQAEFLQEIKETTGLSVRVLSGYEEAYLTFLGALSMLDHQSESEKHLVLDIGGGSTELAYGCDDKLMERHSFNMGCVRFTERFLKDDPPDRTQIESCRNAILQLLDTYRFEISESASLVGVAGTATSLAFVDKKLKHYESSELAGHVLSRSKVTDYIRNFSESSASHLLKQYPVVMEGRADIFLAGLLILEQVMKKYNFDQLKISTGGIRHGIVINSFDNPRQ